MDSRFLTYLAFTTLLVATPGSTTAVVVRNTLSGGRRGGLAAALGAACANTTHAVAAGLGLSVLVARWPAALDLIRVIGAAYLGWLGARSLARAWMHADGGLPWLDATDSPPSPLGHHPSFREGLAVNLLNPAIISFYLVIVPTFVPADRPAGYFAVLAATHVGLALLFHAGWATALDGARHWLGRPVARRMLEAVTGASLLFLAARVVWPA